MVAQKADCWGQSAVAPMDARKVGATAAKLARLLAALTGVPKADKMEPTKDSWTAASRAGSKVATRVAAKEPRLAEALAHNAAGHSAGQREPPTEPG